MHSHATLLVSPTLACPRCRGPRAVMMMPVSGDKEIDGMPTVSEIKRW
jgi:hypothetical protein